MNLFVTAVDLNKFNKAIFPTPTAGGTPSLFSDITKANLGLIISEFLQYFFPFAGLALFVYLLIGGFSYLTSGGDQKAMEKAQGQITNAVVGFVIIFAAFWIVQIFEFIFNINVFNF